MKNFRWVIPGAGRLLESIERLRATRNKLINERNDARGELAMTCANMETEYDALREERDEAQAKFNVAVCYIPELKQRAEKAEAELAHVRDEACPKILLDEANKYIEQLKAQLSEARKALAALHSTGAEMADLLAICRDDTDTSVCLIRAWGIKETKHKAAIDAAKEGKS